MDIRFDNKVAMVTGAASGMGLACAKMFAASGAKVALVDCQEDNLAQATRSVQEKGAGQGYRLDITDTPAIAHTVSRIRAELGEVDILVCCAGISKAHLAEDVTEASWDAMLSINTRGLFFCNQAVAVQSMIPRRSGAIVNISSVTGLVGMPLPLESADYCASKAGVLGLTRQEAVEWARYNIRVNAVAPGFVITPMTKKLMENPERRAAALKGTPLNRFAEADDIAAVVCFLASDAAKMITGVVLPVDGGWTAW